MAPIWSSTILRRFWEKGDDPEFPNLNLVLDIVLNHTAEAITSEEMPRWRS